MNAPVFDIRNFRGGENGWQMKITVDKIKDAAGLESCFSIRRRVFVEEQAVREAEEYDGLDSVSTHFLAQVDGDPAGTARWRKTDKGYKLERFAVLKEFRGMGVGSALVQSVLADLPQDLPHDVPVYLNAQLQAMDLYRKFGFREEGSSFLEAGIRHYRMRR